MLTGLLSTLTLGDILSTAIGVIALGIDSYSLINNLRQLNTYKEFRKKLETLKLLPKANEKILEEEEMIFKWLQVTETLSEPIKQKLQMRFIITIGIIIAGSIFVARDLSGEALVNYQAFETVDIPVLIGQIIVGLMGNSSFLLTSDEKAFLSNAAALHSLYYTSIILPAIQKYNENFDQTEMLRRARNYWQQEISHLEKDIRRVKRPPRGNRF